MSSFTVAWVMYFVCDIFLKLTFKVLVSTVDLLGHIKTIIAAYWEAMWDVEPVRYEPAILLSCSTIMVLSYNNCQRSSHSMSE